MNVPRICLDLSCSNENTKGRLEEYTWQSKRRTSIVFVRRRVKQFPTRLDYDIAFSYRISLCFIENDIEYSRSGAVDMFIAMMRKNI